MIKETFFFPSTKLIMKSTNTPEFGKPETRRQLEGAPVLEGAPGLQGAPVLQGAPARDITTSLAAIVSRLDLGRYSGVWSAGVCRCVVE